MKQLFLIIAGMMLLAACNDQQQESGSRATSTDSIENAIQQYSAFLATLDSSDMKTTTYAAQKFSELFKTADKNTADAAFLHFETYYAAVENSLNARHANDTTDYMPLIMQQYVDRPIPVPEKIKTYNSQLQSNGFAIKHDGEGNTYIGQYRDFVATHFYTLLSPVMKEYLEQVNREDKEGFLADAGIVIEPKQHVDRIIWWERFIQKNPDFILSSKANENKKGLLAFLLTGIDNTPLLSYEDQSLEDYYKTAYAYLENTFPDSQTNQLVNPYYKALQQKDKARAEALLKEYRNKGYLTSFE